MDKNNIKKLLRKGERLTLEAKLAKTDVPKSVWESYSAFANTMGGTILFFDLPRPFRMEGIQRVDDTPLHKACVRHLQTPLSMLIFCWMQACFGLRNMKTDWYSAILGY